MSFLKDFPIQLFKVINYIPKRARVVASMLIMSAVILISTFFDFVDSWWFFLPLFTLLAYGLTYFAVFEGIDGVEWLTLFIMPVLFTIAFYLFYSLFPVRWLTRLPYMVVFALLFYAILLISNILNVVVEKSLQLYRAAFSVNYLFQTFIVLLLTQVVLTFKQSFLLNGIVVFILSFALAIQLLWSINPTVQWDKKILFYSFVVAILLAQVAIIVSFLPLSSAVAALEVTATYYAVAGIMYHHLDQRLFKHVIREYLFVTIFVSAIALLTIA